MWRRACLSQVHWWFTRPTSWSLTLPSLCFIFSFSCSVYGQSGAISLHAHKMRSALFYVILSCYLTSSFIRIKSFFSQIPNQLKTSQVTLLQTFSEAWSEILTSLWRSVGKKISTLQLGFFPSLLFRGSKKYRLRWNNVFNHNNFHTSMPKELL